jgi:bisphosphoglycerate-independent phosphoglycerate mutase (AlkP superfamily)
VPFILISEKYHQEGPPQRITVGANVTGILQDVAPTILTVLGIGVPPEMAGANLTA